MIHAAPRHRSFLVVSCLRCGFVRGSHRSRYGHLDAVECPWCGDVGWQEVEEPEGALGGSRRVSDTLLGWPATSALS